MSKCALVDNVLGLVGVHIIIVEGYYRSQHSRDGGTTTERTTGRISWGEKRTGTNSLSTRCEIYSLSSPKTNMIA